MTKTRYARQSAFMGLLRWDLMRSNFA